MNFKFSGLQNMYVKFNFAAILCSTWWHKFAISNFQHDYMSLIFRFYHKLFCLWVHEDSSQSWVRMEVQFCHKVHWRTLLPDNWTLFKFLKQKLMELFHQWIFSVNFFFFLEEKWKYLPSNFPFYFYFLWARYNVLMFWYHVFDVLETWISALAPHLSYKNLYL